MPGFPFGAADGGFPRFDRTVEFGERGDAFVSYCIVADMSQQVCYLGYNHALFGK